MSHTRRSGQAAPQHAAGGNAALLSAAAPRDFHHGVLGRGPHSASGSQHPRPRAWHGGAAV